VSLRELHVFTLFPHWFAWLTEERPVQRALAGGVELGFHSYRDYSPLKHRAVDDAPFGGGAGMVLRVDVVAAAVEGAYGAALDEVRATRRLVALDPGGRPLDDAYARELATSERVSLLCGRYEGFDARVLEHVATESLSLGPFVLSGGEPAAMAVCDALLRLQPGALGDEASSEEESFSPALEGDLEYPHYTRPDVFRGWRVPEVLLSGDHGRIAAWRREQARLRRPDARIPPGSPSAGLRLP
jgi:tRNA (guanine37-N1)-methyltransferase